MFRATLPEHISTSRWWRRYLRSRRRFQFTAAILLILGLDIVLALLIFLAALTFL